MNELIQLLLVLLVGICSLWTYTTLTKYIAVINQRIRFHEALFILLTDHPKIQLTVAEFEELCTRASQELHRHQKLHDQTK